MTEEQDLISQIDRAKELKKELDEEVKRTISQNEVSLKTRNLTEEILVKLRTCLDKIIYYRLKRDHSSVDLTKIYFPICKSRLDFDSLTKRYGLNTLKEIDPVFFSLIESFQPFYLNGNKYLEILQEKGSKEKHQFLINQKKEEKHVKTTIKSPRGGISWTTGVRFKGNISVMGVPINTQTQEPAFIPPTHQLIKHYQVTVKLSEKDVEVSSLCNSLINSVEKIVNEVINLK